MNFRITRLQPKTKLKQKLTQRTIALAMVLFLSVSTLCMMVILSLNQPVRMQAKSTYGPNVILVHDQELITEKSLDAPKINPRPASTAQTIFVRPMVKVQNTARN